MTHSNPNALIAVAAYNIGIAHLLNNPGDRSGTIEKVDNYLKEYDSLPLYKEWWLEDVMQGRLCNCQKKIGWIRLAFTYAFHYLKNDWTYKDSMQDILSKGGDTDTNACIVGGLMGACEGIDAIPEEWVDAVLNSEYKRPDWLRTKSESEFFEMLDKLEEFKPKSDEDVIIE